MPPSSTLVMMVFVLIEEPLHGENLPFAFNEMCETDALVLQEAPRPEYHVAVRPYQEHGEADQRQPRL